MADVVAELEIATGQRLVRIVKLDARHRRHETIDPSVAPPQYSH